MMTCIGEMDDPFKDIEGRGWRNVHKEDGHFWMNSQVDYKGPKEVCMLCLTKRKAKEVTSC